MTTPAVGVTRYSLVELQISVKRQEKLRTTCDCVDSLASVKVLQDSPGGDIENSQPSVGR